MTNLTIEAKSKQLNCFYEFVLDKLFYTLDFFLLPSFYFPIYYCSILSNILHNPCWGTELRLIVLNGTRQQPNTELRFYLPFLDAASKSSAGTEEKRDLAFRSNFEDSAFQ